MNKAQAQPFFWRKAYTQPVVPLPSFVILSPPFVISSVSKESLFAFLWLGLMGSLTRCARSRWQEAWGGKITCSAVPRSER
jgi:hypothetical protein